MSRERLHITCAPRGPATGSTLLARTLDTVVARAQQFLDRGTTLRAGRPAPNLKASVHPFATAWISERSQADDVAEDGIVSSLLVAAIRAEQANALRAELEALDLEEWRDREGEGRRRGIPAALRLFDLEHPDARDKRAGEDGMLLKIELIAHLPAQTPRERSARDEYLDQLHGTFGFVVDARRAGQSAHFVAYLATRKGYDPYGFFLTDIVRLLKHRKLLDTATGARLLRGVCTARPWITTVPKEDWAEYRDDPARIALLRSARAERERPAPPARAE